MIVFKILKWMVLLLVSIFIIWVIGRALFCEPDKSVLKLTDPLAKEILHYINKHGRPKSLADIPNLPYRMEKCITDKPYIQKHYGTTKTEHCVFRTKNEEFLIEINHFTYYTSKEYSFGITITSEAANAYVHYYFKKDKKINELIQRDFYIHYYKRPFLCGYLRLTQ